MEKMYTDISINCYCTKKMKVPLNQKQRKLDIKSAIVFIIHNNGVFINKLQIFDEAIYN